MKVVVKLATRYHAKAHRLLADKGFAPKLHACRSILGGLYMVVMDRIRGGTPLGLVPERIPQAICEDVEDAMSLLHKHDNVFGDLRPPNIMILPSGRAMLVEFDWADKDSVGVYPPMLNDDLAGVWASGVQRGGIMKKEHDSFMLERLRSRIMQR